MHCSNCRAGETHRRVQAQNQHVPHTAAGLAISDGPAGRMFYLLHRLGACQELAMQERDTSYHCFRVIAILLRVARTASTPPHYIGSTLHYLIPAAPTDMSDTTTKDTAQRWRIAGNARSELSRLAIRQ